MLRYYKEKLKPLVVCQDVVGKCVFFLFALVEAKLVEVDKINTVYMDLLKDATAGNVSNTGI